MFNFLSPFQFRAAKQACMAEEYLKEHRLRLESGLWTEIGKWKTEELSGEDPNLFFSWKSALGKVERCEIAAAIVIVKLKGMAKRRKTESAVRLCIELFYFYKWRIVVFINNITWGVHLSLSDSESVKWKTTMELWIVILECFLLIAGISQQ